MNKNSLAAYRRLGEFLEGHNFTIYEVLLANGPQTCWGIASTTWSDGIYRRDFDQLYAEQVFRRMRDLERAGFVERMDWVQDSPSGRACSVWWVKA